MFIALVLLGCTGKKEIVEPPVPSCSFPHGNRTFTWRLDTVAWFPSILGGVWAFSDSDAWIMGSMAGPPPGQTGYVGLHWNGNEWKEKKTFLDLLIEPNDVIGDDHFMVSVGYRLYGDNNGGTISKATICEYNNSTAQWKTIQYETLGELRCVWTDDKGYFIAAGDNGMTFVKDGYSDDWIYAKMPTNFSITSLAGISKSEIYARSGISLATGENYHQYWKYDGINWIKLYDEEDTSGTPIKLNGTENSMNDIAAFRCDATDSLNLYLIGWESFLLQSKSQNLEFTITNLTNLGLPLRNLGRTAFRICQFTPNDIWIFGTRYNFYHWNGIDFQKMVIPGFPNTDTQFGDQGKMIKLSTGKVFLPSEISSQIYIVAQGTL